MIFDTWFLSGLNFPRCSNLRSVALSANVDERLQRLTQVWRDRHHPHWPVRVSQVSPDPPGRLPRQHRGHLLVLQHEGPEETGVVLSQYQGLANIEPLDRFAHLIPVPVSFDRLLWFNDLEVICEQPRSECVASISRQTPWQPAAGQHLEFYVLDRQPKEDDHLNLMQGLAQHIDQPPQSALDLASPDHENCQFQFNVHAAAFVPTQGNIIDFDEFTQDLHRIWTMPASAWEEEDRSCNIAVWS